MPTKAKEQKLLNIYDFGKHLLETRDLDPVYVVLWEAELDDSALFDYLLAYWCFYHMGTAAWIAEGRNCTKYWNRFTQAAGSKEYPRATERRHFRGDNAEKSVAYLFKRGIKGKEGIGSWFSFCKHWGLSPPLKDVMDYVQKWVGFGPWIAFKVADMLERLDLVKVDYSGQQLLVYESPRKGMELFWKIERGPNTLPGNLEDWATERLLKKLGHYDAPPRYERKVGFPEMETIFCKWYSHMSGHYEIGKDTCEIRHHLLQFAKCRLAQDLLKAGKRAKLW